QKNNLQYEQKEEKKLQTQEKLRYQRKSSYRVTKADSVPYPDEHLPNICRCQKNTEDAENRAAEDQTETNIHEAKDIEQPDKNRSNHSCTVESRGKKSADVLGSSKDIVSDSAKEGKQEKDFPSLAFSAQQDDLQPVVDTDESGSTSVGTITFRCSSDASDCLQSEDGLIAELKCGPFNVKVEVEKNAVLGIGTDYAAKKCQCHKKRWYHKEQSCKWHKEPSPPSKCSGKYEIPSRYTVHIANKQNPSMKLNIVGKEIKIKYINRKQKLMVSIEPDKEPKKCIRTGSPKYKNKFVSNTDYSAPEASCHSDLESDFSFQEKEEAFTGCMNPEWCTFIPPPAEFADSEEIGLESTTEVASLSPTDTFSVALNCGDNNDLHPGKDKRRMGCANGKDFYKDIIFSEFSYTGESSEEDYGSKEKHFGKKPNDVMTDVHQARNSSLVDTRHIMLISHTESKNSRRYSFPATTIDILSSIHPRRDSGFYSMPSLSLKLLSKPAKATHTYSKGNHIPLSYTERSSSFTSLFGNFSDLRSSCCYAFTSYDHDITMYNAELEERNPIGNSFFMNHCLECMEDCREMDQVAVGNFQSNINSSGEQKEKNRSSEALSTFDVCREYTEYRKDGFHCEVLQNDPHEVQMYEELQNETQLNQVCSLSRSPSSSYAYHSNTYTKAGTESIQDQHSVAQPKGNLQLNIEESDSEVTKKKRRGSVMTVITGELERRLLIQGDSKNVADTVGLAIKKESMLPCSIRETFMSPLLDVEESDLDNDFQSFTEVQEMPEKFNGDSTCQDHSTQAAANYGSLEDEQILAGTFFTEEPGTFSSEQDLCPSDDFGEHFTRDQMQELPKPNYENPEEQSEINMELSQNPGKLLPENQTEQTEDPSMLLPDEKTSSDARANDSSREEAVDHWARRRKQFKNSKRCGSTGGSSITSTITEGSINSEDGRSLDFSLHGESEEKGFYTEIFHSTSWVFRGDDASPDNSPRCLSKRPRPVAVRERTVRIAKGTGDYPWGFRIQFSKPILVTEVDTNSAAEEAGLQIGDIVLAVNGTDVTSIPHSEAANLARKGNYAHARKDCICFLEVFDSGTVTLLIHLGFSAAFRSTGHGILLDRLAGLGYTIHGAAFAKSPKASAYPRLLMGTVSQGHITPVLFQLHRLLVEVQAQFKVLPQTFKALNRLGLGTRLSEGMPHPICTYPDPEVTFEGPSPGAPPKGSEAVGYREEDLFGCGIAMSKPASECYHPSALEKLTLTIRASYFGCVETDGAISLNNAWYHLGIINISQSNINNNINISQSKSTLTVIIGEEPC
ncbi:PDZ and LIM domain protein Zasp, partial [Varanus komodoensis]